MKSADMLRIMQAMPIEDFFKRKDPLAASRKEYKFVLPLDILPDVFEFLSEDFLCSTFGDEAVYQYHTTYFDTSDFKFFNMHRQGKYNRVKIRIREYLVGMQNSFVECKRKVKGVHTQKERAEIDEFDVAALNEPFIQAELVRHGLTADDLKNRTQIRYSRIFLISKDFEKRITVDFDVSFKNAEGDGQWTPLVPDYCILEIKERGLPKKIMNYLKRTHNIRKTGFSKYCISLSLMHDHLHSNPWKQVIKRYCS